MNRDQLQRLDVWDGSGVDEGGVVTAGLEAFVYSPWRAQPKVCCVSSCASGRVTRLLLADLPETGHDAAPIAAELRALMRRHAHRIGHGAFLSAAKQRLADSAGDACLENALITTFFAPASRLSLCNVGHPPPLLYRAASRSWVVLDQRLVRGSEFDGAPQGVVELVNYDQFDLRLKAGDLVLCSSRALTESRGAAGERLGVSEVLDVLRTLDVSEPTQLIPRLLGALNERCGVRFCPDDVTLVLLMPKTWVPMLSATDRLLSLIRKMRTFLGFGGVGGWLAPARDSASGEGSGWQVHSPARKKAASPAAERRSLNAVESETPGDAASSRQDVEVNSIA